MNKTGRPRKSLSERKRDPRGILTSSWLSVEERLRLEQLVDSTGQSISEALRELIRERVGLPATAHEQRLRAGQTVIDDVRVAA